jgi:hypothetical protein
MEENGSIAPSARLFDGHAQALRSPPRPRLGRRLQYTGRVIGTAAHVSPMGIGWPLWYSGFDAFFFVGRSSVCLHARGI